MYNVVLAYECGMYQLATRAYKILEYFFLSKTLKITENSSNVLKYIDTRITTFLD